MTTLTTNLRGRPKNGNTMRCLELWAGGHGKTFAEIGAILGISSQDRPGLRARVRPGGGWNDPGRRAQVPLLLAPVYAGGAGQRPVRQLPARQRGRVPGTFWRAYSERCWPTSRGTVMLDRTVRKGDLYETATGFRIPAPRAGLARKGEIISEASMVAALVALGWRCKPPKGSTDEPTYADRP